MTTRNLAIMFTDVKGFTERVSKGKREDLRHLLSVHEKLLAPVIRHFEGTVVKTIGDAFLARFDSSTEAVLCGVTIQEVLRQHNAGAPADERLDVRVAINTGDVELIDGDVMGETVNLAARLEGIAEAGEVYFTESVYLAMNRSEAPSTEIGERTFTGIPYSVRVYRVIQDPNSELARRLATSVHLTAQGPILHGLHDTQIPARHRLRKWGIGGAGVAVLIAAAWLYRVQHRGSGPPEAPARQSDTIVRQTATPAPETSAGKEPAAKSPPQPSLEAHRQQLNRLRQSQGASVALEWLRKQLDRNSDFEPLREEIPALDALSVAESIIQGGLDYSSYIESVSDLLKRYPKSPEVPLSLARTLEGRVHPAYYPLELYRIAIERGANPHNRRIFQLSVSLFPFWWPGQMETGHDLLQRYFGEEAEAWARSALDAEESGAALENAGIILRRRKTAIVDDPYYKALLRIVSGYEDEEEASADLRHFQQVKDSRRQKHILAVYRWVLKPLEEKRVQSFGYSHEDLAARNLATLESLWKGSQ